MAFFRVPAPFVEVSQQPGPWLQGQAKLPFQLPPGKPDAYPPVFPLEIVPRHGMSNGVQRFPLPGPAGGQKAAFPPALRPGADPQKPLALPGGKDRLHHAGRAGPGLKGPKAHRQFPGGNADLGLGKGLVVPLFQGILRDLVGGDGVEPGGFRLGADNGLRNNSPLSFSFI